jgi:hypothetical protein
MNPTPWYNQNVFLTTLKKRMYPNNAFVFVKNKAVIPIVGGINHWWWL